MIENQCVDVRQEIEKYEMMKHKAESLGLIEAQGELTKVTENAYCFDYGKAGIGEVWAPKSLTVFIMMGCRGNVFFIPKWILTKEMKRRGLS